MNLPPLPSSQPRTASPSTQEIPTTGPAAGPATQMLAAGGATAMHAGEDRPTPISAPLPPPPGFEPTGPVDFVPGPPPVDASAETRRPRNLAAFIGPGLGMVALVLLEIGLLLDFGGPDRFWTTVPLWCGFATLAALVGLLASAAREPRGDRAWKVSAAGLTGLAVFWLLAVLPVANTDRGFVLTAALACLGASLWLAPGRKA